MLTVQRVYDFINAYAPYDAQLDHDNSGLLVGDPTAQVHGVHFALDLTPAVIQEALQLGANLIVTHHPIMFSPIQSLLTTDYESRLIMELLKNDLHMLCAHTNLDCARGGINDVLAARLGLTDISGEGFLRVGRLPHPMSAEELTSHVHQCLNTVVRPMGQGNAISRLAVCSGAGSDEWHHALSLNAQAFLSGEFKHHHVLSAVDAGLFCLEAGHYATEEPGIFALADALQNELNKVQWKVQITKSRLGAYITPKKP